MRNTALGMWCRVDGYNFADVPTVLPDSHILADIFLTVLYFFQSQIHYSITIFTHLDFAHQISKITTTIKGNDNFFPYSETPAVSPLHGMDNSTAAFLSLCLMFYYPLARSSLNKPAQSSCPQRRLSCSYHYVRMKRMSRRSECNIGEYDGVGSATDRGSCGGSWPMGLLSIKSLGLPCHKFVPRTGNPSHRFSFPEDFSILFEMWQTSRPEFRC
jgi:hypothetical protein